MWNILHLSLSQQPRRFAVINTEKRLRANQSEQRQPRDAVDLGGAATGCPGRHCSNQTRVFPKGEIRKLRVETYLSIWVCVKSLISVCFSCSRPSWQRTRSRTLPRLSPSPCLPALTSEPSVALELPPSLPTLPSRRRPLLTVETRTLKNVKTEPGLD